MYYWKELQIAHKTPVKKLYNNNVIDILSGWPNWPLTNAMVSIVTALTALSAVYTIVV